MTLDIGLLLGLIVVALAFFSFEWLASDVVAMGLLLALVLTGLLEPADAFAGFGSDTVLMILGLLIMTSALIKTGVVDIVGRAILRHAGTNPRVLLAVIMVACATLSAFISNTAAAAFFLPIALGIAAKAKISPSGLLMPVAFASILTSSVTLISTSTNVVISGLMTHAGLEPMGIFELSPVGIPIAIVGLLYTYFIGRHLVRQRAPVPGLVDEFELRSFISEVVVLPSSPLVGRTIQKANFGRDLDLAIVRVLRGGQYHFPRGDLALRAGDVLLVEGAREDVLRVKEKAGLEIKADFKFSDPDLRSEDASLVEALVVPRSRVIGRPLRDTRMREDYGVQVLALNRHGRNILTKLSQVSLRVGDVLLLQGRTAGIKRLAEEGFLSVLQAVGESGGNRPKAWRAMAIFAVSLGLAASGVQPLPVAVLLGAFAIFAFRCVSPADAYREIDWRVVILIACMLALGQAMIQTGAAAYLAQLVVEWSGDASPRWLLAGFFLLTVVLTQPMSNQAAAAIIVPVALQTAVQLGLNPRAFAMAIAVAASCSYLTPLEPACLMVYGPGRYRFMDFIRAGGPLVIALFALAMILVPQQWPLRQP